MLSGLVPLVALLPVALAQCGATGEFPTPTGYNTNSAVIEIASGETFDGALALYDRGSGACGGQNEGDWEAAVFYLQEGATLRNVIIGADQAEGVHCNGACTLENVWFEDVCEDAISIKNDTPGTETHIIGGGALHASDKVVQHNGCGKVNIVDFYVEDFGKLYRSCGNCDTQCTRSVYLEGIVATGGSELVGINANYGDTAELVNVSTDSDPACQLYDGCEGDCEPQKLGEC